MKRSKRREILENLELMILKSRISPSRRVYQSTHGYDRSTVKEFHKLFRELHPMDYKNKYPNAVDYLVRICYPKKRNLWGRLVEKNQLSITELSIRRGEFIKRFKGLVKKSRENEKDLIELLDLIFSMNLNPEEKSFLLDKLSQIKTVHYDSLKLAIIMSGNGSNGEN